MIALFTLLFVRAAAAAFDGPTTTPTYATETPTTMPSSDSPTVFLGTRTLTKSAWCDTKGCSATMQIDTSGMVVTSASLLLTVGGDIWSPPQSISISVDGKFKGTCASGFTDFCAYPLLPCLSRIDVTKVVDEKGMVEISFETTRAVGKFDVLCYNYPGISTGLAAILTAELELELSETAAPSPTNPPTQQFQKAISETVFCDPFGASLSIEAEGDLSGPDNLLSFAVNGTDAGSCGGMGSSCNLEVNPLLPCLSQIDITKSAQSGLVVVDFESSDLVRTFCTYDGNLGIGAVVQVTIDLVLTED